MKPSEWGKVGGGLFVLVLFGVFLWAFVWPYVRWTEDFLPGTAPTQVLDPQAWTVTESHAVFAAVGDTGTGGRNQMAVARQMVEVYASNPYGLVVHVGDVSYYGSILDRWNDVWIEPYRPLHDAGVRFEVALGNHELEEEPSEEARQWLEERLEKFGLPRTYRVVPYGPVDFFFLDSSTPLIRGEGAEAQLEWLDTALTESTARWKVAVLHHAPYSSSTKRGSQLDVRAALEPLFVAHEVDLVLCGHDHTYERTTPQQGVTYIVTGAGAKLSEVGSSDFTAYSARVLEFLLVEVDGDTMTISAIDTTGTVFDSVELAAKERP